MVISEEKSISQIAFLPKASAINVQWTISIIKEDVVIAETYERKSYTAAQKDEFLSEVDSAVLYIKAIGWE